MDIGQGQTWKYYQNLVLVRGHSYNDNTISGKPYDPTLYNLDDVNAKNRNSTIQFWMDRGRPDIYSQPDLMTENLYTSLLGGVVEDGMWVKGSQQ